MMCGDEKVMRVYAGDVKIYSAGNTVTYHVDTGVTYQEDVDEGGSCLSPTSFTPSKEGWEFVGWREDSAAAETVLTTKVMGDASVTLYAVFKKKSATVTGVSNSAGSTTTKSASVFLYYNNGVIISSAISFAVTASSSFNPNSGERYVYAYVYLSEDFKGKKIAANFSYSTGNSIFAGVSNPKANVYCGTTLIGSYGVNPPYLDTYTKSGTITFTATSTTIKLEAGAHLDKSDNTTQWFNGTLTISNIRISN